MPFFSHPPSVIAPLTTLGHWQREIETWTDMNCVVYAGGQADRDCIQASTNLGSLPSSLQASAQSPVLVHNALHLPLLTRNP
jgi:SNF2 family DNA or RNA helicase